MAIVIPDLFSAAVEGKRLAIQDNYRNLKNAEDITAARIRNEQADLNLMYAADIYNNRLAVSDAATQKALLGAQALLAGQSGRLDDIYTNNALANARAAGVAGNLPTIQDSISNTIGANAQGANLAALQRSAASTAGESLLPEYRNAQFNQQRSAIDVANTNAEFAPAVARATAQGNLATIGANTAAANYSTNATTLNNNNLIPNQQRIEQQRAQVQSGNTQQVIEYQRQRIVNAQQEIVNLKQRMQNEAMTLIGQGVPTDNANRLAASRYEPLMIEQNRVIIEAQQAIDQAQYDQSAFAALTPGG